LAEARGKKLTSDFANNVRMGWKQTLPKSRERKGKDGTRVIKSR